MVILTQAPLTAFGRKHAAAAEVLNTWYHAISLADWANFNELRAQKPDTDYIGNDRYVFNVRTHRIIAMIFFDIRTVFIRAVLTHTEYNRLRASLPTM